MEKEVAPVEEEEEEEVWEIEVEVGKLVEWDAQRAQELQELVVLMIVMVVVDAIAVKVVRRQSRSEDRWEEKKKK